MRRSMKVALLMTLVLCLVIPATGLAKQPVDKGKPHVVTLKVTGIVTHNGVPDAGAMVTITGPFGVNKTVKANVLGRYTANGIKIVFTCPQPPDAVWAGNVSAKSVLGATASVNLTNEVPLDCSKNPYPIHIKVNLATAP